MLLLSNCALVLQPLRWSGRSLICTAKTFPCSHRLATWSGTEQVYSISHRHCRVLKVLRSRTGGHPTTWLTKDNNITYNPGFDDHWKVNILCLHCAGQSQMTTTKLAGEWFSLLFYMRDITSSHRDSKIEHSVSCFSWISSAPPEKFGISS
jgi:hypothetical protein